MGLIFFEKIKYLADIYKDNIRKIMWQNPTIQK